MLLKLACVVTLCQLVYAQKQLTLDEVNEYVGARCITKMGLGECVHYYNCDPATNTFIDDGAGVINKRLQDTEITACPLPLICCGSSDDEQNNGERTWTCGWRNPDGVNFTGEVRENEAKPGEFPWLVNVMRFKNQTANDMAFAYVGDGALIHQRVVLTSAHSVGIIDATLLRVVAGVHNQKRPATLRTIVLVDAVKIHPNFTKENLFNDVALLFLSWNVTFKDLIAPICLPSPTSVAASGTKCISAGWGENGKKQFQYTTAMVELPILNREECQSILRVATDVGRYFRVDDSFICAGGEIGHDTCRGGAGAPLICPIDSQPGRYMASGIVSWDMACGASGVPAVYANVTHARTWIDQTVTERGFSTAIYTI